MQMHSDSPTLETKDIFEFNTMVRARYQWWQLNGVDRAESSSLIPALGQFPAGEFRSCIEADSAARVFVMQGDLARANREIVYLESSGYADPGFIRFCEETGLCAK